jgi:outer membrane protein OmpA-like peptidoglycan-associated protein/tetratricopeptide (TPR) repeat protein
MKKLLLLICLSANIFLAKAQTPQQYLALAQDAEMRKNHAEAAEAYKVVLEDEAFAQDEAMLWATAENCRKSNAPKQALMYYKRIKKPTNFEEYNENIALVHKQLGDYTQANNFFKKISTPSPAIQLAINGCAAAKTPNTEKWQVKAINDKRLNSDVADYFGFMYNDNIYFGSNRATTAIGDNSLNVSGLYFKKEEKTEFLREPDLDKKTAYANACLANDGTWLVFTEANYDEATHTWRSNLRYTATDGRSFESNNTQTPKKLDDALFENATMPHWAKEEMRTFLYFVSDRAGGKGGLDIWRSEYDNGKFAQPENMLINTAGDDITPFYHANGKTLYFSSNGLASQGGFDVYAATNYTYSEPKITLLPAPLNSSFDDFYFGFAETDSTGYLSSTRSPKMLKGENGLCCADIYSFKKRFVAPAPPLLAQNPPPRSFKPKTERRDSTPSPDLPKMPTIRDNPPPIAQNTPPAQDSLPPVLVEEPPVVIETPPVVVEEPPVVIETPRVVVENPPVVVETPPVVIETPPVITKTETIKNSKPQPPSTTTIAESTSITLYFHNDEPDPNTIKTTTSEAYDQTYYRYIAMRRLYVKEYQKGASDKTLAAEQVNAFFEQNVIANFERLESTMQQIKARLERGETVRVHISGHCSPRAASDYNIKLSKRRIACMKNYMQRWQNRSLATYAKNGKLVIENSPFGEQTASKTISDKYTDKRNSIFSPEASAERRVTVTVE